ncbi:Bcr/CflA family efflux MFS transporter [Cupriavidus basilensis]|uniref:Bcr/CflA family efflux transporter n=1 Tax=Cupriavidus basilensis TaxID=68895 RepID=A0ABT6AT23_9BURK|nr:Bcr/CflA family efflux MFS transporter [Cupriavidus basilensis]MDF3835778.1 Bcr/CflA family efflux MFS transporter [Cupriavidus basilensis]
MIILLNLLILLSAIPLDVMLPSFPDLAGHFRTGTTDIALSISVFAVGFSVAQLFVGPLSDRYGRRRLLLIGLLLALAGALGCIFSTRYSSFIACRILQSIGCACFLLAQAIVQDVFKGSEGINIRILTTTLSGIYIACSPLLGSVLQSSSGWRGSFILFSAIAAFLLLYTQTRFEETAEKRHGGLLFYGGEYLRILMDKSFILYSLIGALSFSCHLAFIIISPAIFLDQLGLGNYEYSLVLLTYGCAYILGGLAATRVAKKISTHGQIALGLFFMTISGGIMWLMLRWDTSIFATALFPMLICTAGTVLVRPATASEAMSLFDEIAGTAAAAGSTIRFATAGVMSGIVSKISADIPLNLSWIIIFASAASLLLFHQLSGMKTTRDSQARAAGND